MKKQKQLLFLAIAISTALLAARCAKIETYYLDQETKDYLLFDVGSYWIFQDSATLKTDSIVVTSIKHRIMHPISEGQDEVEVYYIDYTCFDKDTNWLINGMLGSHASDLPDDFSTLRYRFIYTGGPVGTGTYKAYYETYSIANFIFSDVKKFSYYGYEIFFAKHIGCIRFEINTNETDTVYNLIRYNVKPYNK
ncbi:MAG: hypothetical protein LBK03_02645 [Bacteroidales bacterium]|jgi:hypothetical protein|nr:hypothetical protein [Bacteroidales bacterium]